MKNIFLFCFISILMLAGCASSPEVATVELSGVGEKGVIKLHRSLNPENQPVNMDYEHPHDFTVSEIGSEIDLLALRRFKWGKYGMGNKWVKKPLFPGASKDKLISALVSAFKEATGSDRIAFNISGRRDRPTTGEVYLKDNQLVWIFETVDGHPYTGKDRYWLDDQDWTIEERTGLTVREYKDNQIVKVIREMTIKPLKIAEEEAEEQEEEIEERPEPAKRERVVSPGLKDLEKKLETLKRWKDKDLISDEDYQKEKEYILQQLQKL